MELRIDINEKVVAWLASMGYPVAGMPEELLHGMFRREARQWELSLDTLESLIEEGARKSSDGTAADTNETLVDMYGAEMHGAHLPRGLVVDEVR